ncbi:glycoside hydrolase family 43 protein [Zasmidium cellare ATCC 36951]|uniref:Glycoside hydrolase family 43 protein n=1 Tax=Zasmidium cellare ATCC 36951 TaxID=1080233 RepID=A0A6A6CU64_ZASCE|nr:glycoside hydrolase family 43 protein [Zasmidium cellare ATCC 36951]KAF2170694.1 glycoside hydrolase family 43 protein [Zasmidium cellare ATCC 36951]
MWFVGFDGTSPLLCSFVALPWERMVLWRCFRLGKRDPNTDVLGGANFPDPTIINVEGTSYAFGTVDGQGHQVPVVSNPDFNNPSGWSSISDSFPSEGVPAFGPNGWAAPDTVWAPDVVRLTDYDSSFAMYYSPALQSNGGIHCVGVARSANIAGPYNDSSSEPWVCPQEAGGAIDAAGFLDSDNTRYVLYKIDGPAVNNGGYCASQDNIVTNTSLMLQQTQSDGYTKVGSPVSIWNNQGVEDHYQAEAPSLLKSDDGTYFLFYSTGCYTDGSYTTKYVTSTSGIFGPYGNPQLLLKDGDFGQFGPGGADITLAGGQMVYHSLKNNDIAQGRVMNTATLTLEGQSARIN